MSRVFSAKHFFAFDASMATPPVVGFVVLEPESCHGVGRPPIGRMRLFHRKNFVRRPTFNALQGS